ncbi:MAG: hypothetical protein KGL39_45505, partial [Patescibacteria group bacterium]|nr:hypothetical protein [Patescibacteria group bacterium]
WAAWAAWDASVVSPVCLGAIETGKADVLQTWMPTFEAFEAGLWLFLPLDELCLWLPQPVIKRQAQRLHCETGPAFELPGQRLWFWQGIEVPQYVVENPKAIIVPDIETEPNAEVRRIKIERFGQARYLQESGAKEIHRDDFGVLYRKELAGDEPLVMVKVLNSTPEPDGSFKDYFLRVPPNMRRAREAVAWTFGKAEADYEPALES